MDEPIGCPWIDPCSEQAATNWQAAWIKDPLFAGVEPRFLIHPNRTPENNGEIQNVHTLFRKVFDLPTAAIKQARLYITADDGYKLYLNGRFVGLGPAPSFVFDYHYNTYDVTDAVRSGEANVIAAHVFYQGMHSLTFTSGDNLAGLLVQLEIDLVDGQTITVVSDDTWRCRRTNAYEARKIYGYQTAFSEHIDLRRWPAGWEQIDYDDAVWVPPIVGENELTEIYQLNPQPTPPVAVSRKAPVEIIRKADGHYFIDFGCELSGETAFLVTGNEGHEVEIRHGEELSEPLTVRHEMRCNCDYREYCTLSGRADERLAFFDYKGFRYVEVFNWPEELTVDRVWTHERHYPFPENASAFASSNPLLNDIWKLCRNGVRVGTIDTYLDCPTREKGGFLGDGFVTGISHLILTGDARILRKFIKDVANTSYNCPGLHSTAPNYVNGELAEYSLLWPVLLAYYYQWTGDEAFVRQMMPTLEGLLGYYIDYENEAGLLADLQSRATGRYSVLVDWPKNLRDGYDDPYLMGDRQIADAPQGVVNTMVQGFYSNALQAAGRLAEVADYQPIKDLVRGRADRLQHAVLSELRDPATGLFLDRNGSTHSALHANVTPLLAGMLQDEDRDAVVEFIRTKRLSCGVYFSFFVLKALYDVGEADLAYDLMTSRDLHSWHSMLEAGATTCMEAWAPDLKWNTSWCHPWSSSPIHMIAHEMFGLRPATPGWSTIRFAPQWPAALDRASIELTIPQGKLKATMERDGERLIHDITAPAGCTVIGPGGG